MSFGDLEFKTTDSIKIYTGTTQFIREQYIKTIDYLKKLVPDDQKLFTPPIPSTLTAQGLMSNVSFDEKDIINMLSDPVDDIMLIGCNYGEKYNSKYEKPKIQKKSGRGRKPKPKEQPKRRSQGNGKYFSSQITFVIKHPDNGVDYKIKLFRNGVFQVPGIKDPSMSDLIKPIEILRKYLAYNFAEDVQVLNFTAVMRNYKSKLINESLFVDLITLESIIEKLKRFSSFDPFIRYTCRTFNKPQIEKVMKFVGKTNPLNIAEITYNTDKCFCLNLKFYRPIPDDIDKKTTVKLLKKGKINFDGGNSEYEMLELYHWLEYIYYTYKDKILVDTSAIKNEYHLDLIDSNALIYSDGETTDHIQPINLDNIANACADNVDDTDDVNDINDISKVNKLILTSLLGK